MFYDHSTAANSSGDESFYYYVYDNVTLTIEVINVTWPRYYVSVLRKQCVDADKTFLHFIRC